MLTGQGLIGYLSNLVDFEWNEVWKALFYTEEIGFNYFPLFVIEANPTRQQPGNGLVQIRNNNNNLISYTYSTNPANGVLNAILSPFFPEFWKNFMTKEFGFSRLDMSQEIAACILLTFEIARRTGNDQNQLTRQQVSEAIYKVMNFLFSNTRDYENMVRVVFR